MTKAHAVLCYFLIIFTNYETQADPRCPESYTHYLGGQCLKQGSSVGCGTEDGRVYFPDIVLEFNQTLKTMNLELAYISTGYHYDSGRILGWNGEWVRKRAALHMNSPFQPGAGSLPVKTTLQASSIFVVRPYNYGVWMYAPEWTDYTSTLYHPICIYQGKKCRPGFELVLGKCFGELAMGEKEDHVNYARAKCNQLSSGQGRLLQSVPSFVADYISAMKVLPGSVKLFEAASKNLNPCPNGFTFIANRCYRTQTWPQLIDAPPSCPSGSSLSLEYDDIQIFYAKSASPLFGTSDTYVELLAQRQDPPIIVPEDCMARLVGTSLHDFGIKSLASSISTYQLFDVPCDLKLSYACGFILPPTKKYENIMVGDVNAPWPACIIPNKRIGIIYGSIYLVSGSFSDDLLRCQEIVQNPSYYATMWTSDGQNCVYSRSDVDLNLLIDAPGHFSAHKNCTPDMLDAWTNPFSRANTMYTKTINDEPKTYEEAAAACKVQRFIYGTDEIVPLMPAFARAESSVLNLFHQLFVTGNSPRSNAIWIPYKNVNGQFLKDADNCVYMEGSSTYTDYEEIVSGAAIFKFAPSEPNAGAGFECQKAVVSLDSDIVEFSPVSCLEKIQYICQAPVSLNDFGEQYKSKTAVCISEPYDGDIACDFESQFWNEGHCNWHYSYLSRQTLEWFDEELGNHAVKLEGIGMVVLQSVAEYHCAKISSGALFGFRYKAKNSVITVGKESVIGPFRFGGFMKSKDFELSEDFNEWTYFHQEICLNNPGRYFKVIIKIENLGADSFAIIDDIGPCAFHQNYNAETSTCWQSGSIGDSTDLKELSQHCMATAIDGKYFNIDPVHPLTKQLKNQHVRWSSAAKYYMHMGVKINNGFGQRKFLNDGGFVHSYIDSELLIEKDPESLYKKNCTDLYCNVKAATIQEDGSASSNPDIDLVLICEGDRRSSPPYESGTWKELEFWITKQAKDVNLEFSKATRIVFLCTSTKIQMEEYDDKKDEWKTKDKFQADTACDPSVKYKVNMTKGGKDTIDIGLYASGAGATEEFVGNISMKEKDFKDWTFSSSDFLVRYLGGCDDPLTWSTDYKTCYQFFPKVIAPTIEIGTERCKELVTTNPTMRVAQYSGHIVNFIKGYVTSNIFPPKTPYSYYVLLQNKKTYRIDMAECNPQMKVSDCDSSEIIACASPAKTASNVLLNRELGCRHVASTTEGLFNYTSPFMTVQFCIEICRGKGYQIAGLQFDYCICPPSLSNLEKRPQALCNGSCAFNKFQSCGSDKSFEYFSFYKITDFFNPLNGESGTLVPSGLAVSFQLEKPMVFKLGSGSILSFSSTNDLATSEYSLDLTSGLFNDVATSASSVISSSLDLDAVLALKITANQEICIGKLSEEYVCLQIPDVDLSLMSFIGSNDGDWSLFPYTYEPIAETCKQFYMLGIIPDQGECLELQTNISTNIKCCWNNIDPLIEGQVCSSDNAILWDGDCYFVSPFVSDMSNNFSAYEVVRQCFLNGSTVSTASSEAHEKSIGELLFYYPSSYLFEMPLLTGLYNNPYGLFRVSSNFYKPSILDPREGTRPSYVQGACNFMDITKPIHQYELKAEACNKPSWAICQKEEEFIPLQIKMESYPNGDIVGGYVHSLNSISSCFAYCGTKDATESIVITASTCICSSRASHNDLPSASGCSHLVPCAGSPLQICGCLEFLNDTEIYPMSMKMIVPALYKDCDDLRAHGIFVSGSYNFQDGTSKKCFGWDTVCPDDWILFGDQCLKLSESEGKFSDKGSLCPHGSAFTHFLLKFWMEEHGISSPSTIWGPYDSDGKICHDGSLSETDCNEKKFIFCAMKICADDEHLIGDNCISISATAGDVKGKPDCENLPHSFNNPQNSLNDVTTLLSIHAYLVNLKEVGMLSENDEFHVGQFEGEDFCMKLGSPNETYAMTSCTSGIYQCFTPVTCPIGSVKIAQKCVVLSDMSNIGTELASSSEYCSSRGHHLPSVVQAEEAQFPQIAMKVLGLYGIHSSSAITFPVGLYPDLGGKTLNLADGQGTYGLSSISYEDLVKKLFISKYPRSSIPNANGALAYGDDAISSISVCESSLKGYCISKTGLQGSGFKTDMNKKQGKHLSTHQCIQMCHLNGKELTFIWKEGPVTTCSCEDQQAKHHLFEIHRSHRGRCNENCEGQICGDSDSAFVALNENYPKVGSSCEEIIMFTSNPPASNLVSFENGLEVNCGYANFAICQAPLISKATDIKVNGKPVNLQTSPTSLRQWYLVGGDNLEDTSLEVTFSKIMAVKFIYAAWSVHKIEYSLYKPEVLQTLKNGESDWTFSNESPMPLDISLPGGVLIGWKFLIHLKPSQNQLSPFFELRGCLIDDGFISVPPSSSEDHFVYSINNGLVYAASKLVDETIKNYSSAQDFCKSKNDGSLVIVDSFVTAEGARNVISNHLKEYNYQSPKFLVGLARDGNDWSYVNGLPLGNFMIWADGEPTFDKDCIVIDVPDNSLIATQELTWTTHDCDEIPDTWPICQYNYKVNYTLPQQITCVTFTENDWTLKANDSSTSNCKTTCRNEHYHWSYANQTNCYCSDILISGIISDEKCDLETSIDPIGLWTLTCNDLKSFPEKNLYLRDHFSPYYIGSFAVYECAAGHATESLVVNATIYCEPGGQWSLPPDQLDECSPVFCTAPPKDIPKNALWSLEYRLYFQDDVSPVDTAFKVSCPENAYLADGVSEFEASCHVDGWHVTEGIGCSLEEDATTCQNLTLNEGLRCMYPLCPEPNGTDATDLKFVVEDTYFKYLNTDGFLELETDQIISFSCKEPFKQFRMPETEKPLQKLNFTCKFDASQKKSSWVLAYEGANITEIPECAYHCLKSPKVTAAHLDVSWNGQNWSGSFPIFKCVDGTAFDLPRPDVSTDLVMACSPYPNPENATKVDWYFTHPVSKKLSQTLPKCVFICSDDPPWDEELHNRTWREGYKGIGEKAEYFCKEEGFMFKQFLVYKSIQLECMFNDGEARWQWLDHNNEPQTELPECIDTPLCPSIQDQVDPSQPFQEDYVTNGFVSYVAVKGDYYNSSMPVTSAVTLACFYPDEVFRINDNVYLKINMTCNFFPEESIAKWAWTNPENKTEEFDLPLCLSKCRSKPPSIEGTLRTWSGMNWLGEKAKYRCKNHLLFQVSDTHGVEFIEAECYAYGTMEPWWRVDQQKPCKEGLQVLPEPVDQIGMVIYLSSSTSLGLIVNLLCLLHISFKLKVSVHIKKVLFAEAAFVLAGLSCNGLGLIFLVAELPSLRLSCAFLIDSFPFTFCSIILVSHLMSAVRYYMADRTGRNRAIDHAKISSFSNTYLSLWSLVLLLSLAVSSASLYHFSPLCSLCAGDPHNSSLSLFYLNVSLPTLVGSICFDIALVKFIRNQNKTQPLRMVAWSTVPFRSTNRIHDQLEDTIPVQSTLISIIGLVASILIMSGVYVLFSFSGISFTNAQWILLVPPLLNASHLPIVLAFAVRSQGKKKAQRRAMQPQVGLNFHEPSA